MEPELAETLAATPSTSAPTATAVELAPTAAPVLPDATLTAPPRTSSATPAVTAVAALDAGHRLGHFRIDRPLGAGGMGEVYLATDLSLDRQVAIKVLPTRVAQDATRRERMIREARAQARVTHPNVGHIYFVGEDNTRLYFAMEYVAGVTLGERLAAGPLPIEDALAMIRGAALGLREAQRNGFTHRDVKPSNLMLDSHGMVKVLDFGLAAGDPGRDEGGPVAQTSLAGTPLYMAPEQARGDAIDLRADIYALGATLYHLVTGRPPFQADTLDALVSMHATSARPLLRRRGIPRRLARAVDSLVARMMAPRPDDRFATYDDLILQLELASREYSRPAGGAIRLIASGVDLLAVTLVIGLAAFLYSFTGGGGDVSGSLILLAFGVYAGLTTARWGSTLGQALLELEILDPTTGKRPRAKRIILRSLASIALPLAAVAPTEIAGAFGYQPTILGVVLRTILFSGNLVALIWASGWSVGKRTPWDLVSHTLVRYRGAKAA